MQINWKVRIKNPVFWVQIGLSILTPILAYLGISAEDLNSWGALWAILLEAIKSPYVLGLVFISVWNAINDPTTSGVSDSLQALTYTQPKKKE